jgi:uncharacterized membrane protein YphA (DoxX/SURF4 family)
MNTQKRNQIFFWILTLLVLLPTGGSAVPELFSAGPHATVQSYQSLGYPLYLMKILGFAKILGAVAILIGRSQRITEWAYAGFGILFLGATALHLLAADPAHAPIPLAFFGVLSGSYLFWNKSNAQPLSYMEKS